MDQQELQKNIALYYTKLPPKLQEVFSAMKWLAVLSEIGEKYSLKESERQLLGTETTLVLLCVISIYEYEERLNAELSLPTETIEQILTEITNRVLKDILPELVSTFEANSRETEANDNTGDNPEYYRALEEISRRSGLNVEEMGAMEKVVTGVIKGEIKAENMNASLSRALPSLPEEKISSLSAEINDQILRKIREKLKAESSFSSSSLEDKAVLNKAGIEILEEGMTPTPTPSTPKVETKVPPAPKPAPSAPQPAPEPLPVVQTLEIEGETLKMPETKPIWAQKLTTPVQAKSTKTEHSPASVVKDPSPTKTYPKGQDPYRLPPI